MQTHSITVTLQINFEYDESAKRYGDAADEALSLAVNPNFHSLLNGTKITSVKASDLESGLAMAEWGED